MCKSCDYPDEIECVDNRCMLTMGCKLLEKCMNTLSNGIYKGMTCLCNYKENGSLVYQTPECILSTSSPTMSPTMLPTNSSLGLLSDSEIEESGRDSIENYIVFFIIGGVTLILLILLYFRNRVKTFFGSCNRVESSNDV